MTEAGASRKVKVTFFDVEKAKNEINAVCNQFLRLFEDIEFLSAEEIVVGFSRNCAGREHEIDIIERQQPMVERSSVDILGSTEVSCGKSRNCQSKFNSAFLRDSQ